MKKEQKRIFRFAIALCLAASLLPTAVLAAESGGKKISTVAVIEDTTYHYQIKTDKGTLNPGEKVTATVQLLSTNAIGVGSLWADVTFDETYFKTESITCAAGVGKNTIAGGLRFAYAGENFAVAATGTTIATIVLVAKDVTEETRQGIDFGNECGVSNATDGASAVITSATEGATVTIIPAITGYSVTGAVNFNGAASFETTAKIYKSEDVTGTGKVDESVVPVATVIAGADKRFSFESVANGTYVVVASKKNHTDAFVFNVTVAGGPVAIGQPLELYAGDLNGSNVINGADKVILAGVFGQLGQMYDLNGDGIINGIDKILLVGRFGTVAWEHEMGEI